MHKDYDCIFPHQIWFSSDTGERSQEEGGGIRPPRSERVFEIPVLVGLRSGALNVEDTALIWILTSAKTKVPVNTNC